MNKLYCIIKRIIAICFVLVILIDYCYTNINKKGATYKVVSKIFSYLELKYYSNKMYPQIEFTFT